MRALLRGLVVDDNGTFAEDASFSLEERFKSLGRLDIDFQSCSTYLSARQRLQGPSRQQPPYDIVFVDMLMPRASAGRDAYGPGDPVEYGLDVVSWADQARVPVIVGYSQAGPKGLDRLSRLAREQGAHFFYYRTELFGPAATTREAIEEVVALLAPGRNHRRDGASPASMPDQAVTPTATTGRTIPAGPIDRRRVAVVHGRNRDATTSLFTFLRAVNLTPVEWDQAVQWTGHGAPTTPDVLDILFANVQAVVVLLSPDEEVRLRASLVAPGQDDQAGHQARPNVYFEAGSALALHTDRTILVQVGDVRPASDLAARHVIRMDNTAQTRHALAAQLERAGCAVQRYQDWFEAGDFEGCVVFHEDTG